MTYFTHTLLVATLVTIHTAAVSGIIACRVLERRAPAQTNRSRR